MLLWIVTVLLTNCHKKPDKLKQLFLFNEIVVDFCSMNLIKEPLHIIATATAQTPFSITAKAKDGIALITISGYISQWSKASSSDIAETIATFKEKGITEAVVYVNTQGGSVFEAIEIDNLLEDNFETIKVRVGALAASAGTYFCAKYHTTAKSNSQFMIHKPMSGASGNEDEIEATLKLLKNTTNDFRKLYANKMAITEAEVNKMWDKGDYWMTAKEAKEKGLIDAIDGEEKIDANMRQLLVACGAPVIPEITSEKTKTDNIMKLEVLIALLGMPSDSTEAQVKAKLETLKASAEKVVELEATAKAKEKAVKTAKIKAILDQGEVDKKFTPDQRGNFEKMLNADFDSAKSIIDSLPGIEGAPSEGIKATTTEVSAAKKAWKYEQWRNEDPKGFEALPEATQNELLDAHYKAQV